MITITTTPTTTTITARASAPAPAGGALTSLTALGTVLNTVDTASIVGRSGMPMMQFKSDGDGTWMFGQRRTIVEDGSRWAVNPTDVQAGLHLLRRR